MREKRLNDNKHKKVKQKNVNEWENDTSCTAATAFVRFCLKFYCYIMRIHVQAIANHLCCIYRNFLRHHVTIPAANLLTIPPLPVPAYIRAPFYIVFHVHLDQHCWLHSLNCCCCCRCSDFVKISDIFYPAHLCIFRRVDRLPATLHYSYRFLLAYKRNNKKIKQKRSHNWNTDAICVFISPFSRILT